MPCQGKHGIFHLRVRHRHFSKLVQGGLRTETAETEVLVRVEKADEEA
jgi:hypothetical protein